MYLFFDTETTGVPKNYKAPLTDLDNWPRLVQLGYVIYNDKGELIREEDVLIRPNGFIIPIEASNVHGVSTEKALAEGQDLEKVLLDFFQGCDDADVVVAHNMAFDEKIMGAEFLRLGIKNILDEKKKICTMLSSTNLLKIPGMYGGFKWPKLQELHVHLFGEEFDGAHNAFADIEATARCYFELKRLNKI